MSVFKISLFVIFITINSSAFGMDLLIGKKYGLVRELLDTELIKYSCMSEDFSILVTNEKEAKKLLPREDILTNTNGIEIRFNGCDDDFSTVIGYSYPISQQNFELIRNYYDFFFGKYEQGEYRIFWELDDLVISLGGGEEKYIDIRALD